MSRRSADADVGGAGPTSRDPDARQRTSPTRGSSVARSRVCHGTRWRIACRTVRSDPASRPSGRTASRRVPGPLLGRDRAAGAPPAGRSASAAPSRDCSAVARGVSAGSTGTRSRPCVSMSSSQAAWARRRAAAIAPSSAIRCRGEPGADRTATGAGAGRPAGGARRRSRRRHTAGARTRRRRGRTEQRPPRPPGHRRRRLAPRRPLPPGAGLVSAAAPGSATGRAAWPGPQRVVSAVAAPGRRRWFGSGAHAAGPTPVTNRPASRRTAPSRSRGSRPRSTRAGCGWSGVGVPDRLLPRVKPNATRAGIAGRPDQPGQRGRVLHAEALLVVAGSRPMRSRSCPGCVVRLVGEAVARAEK